MTAVILDRAPDRAPDRAMDCPDCGSVGSVRGGICDLCLADLGEYRPAGPGLPSTVSPPTSGPRPG